MAETRGVAEQCVKHMHNLMLNGADGVNMDLTASNVLAYFPALVGCTLLTSLLTDLVFQGRTSTMENISMNLSRSVTQKMFSGNSLVRETHLQTFLVRPPFS